MVKPTVSQTFFRRLGHMIQNQITVQNTFVCRAGTGRDEAGRWNVSSKYMRKWSSDVTGLTHGTHSTAQSTAAQFTPLNSHHTTHTTQLTPLNSHLSTHTTQLTPHNSHLSTHTSHTQFNWLRVNQNKNKWSDTLTDTIIAACPMLLVNLLCLLWIKASSFNILKFLISAATTSIQKNAQNIFKDLWRRWLPDIHPSPLVSFVLPCVLNSSKMQMIRSICQPT